MYLAYYDESGDDGFPAFSSPLFVLTACVVHYLNWKSVFDEIHSLRRELKAKYGIPVRAELHWKKFLTNKNPYRALSIPDSDRLDIATRFCDVLAQQEIRFVNVAIVKPRIKADRYPILDRAFTYSIQRIENDLQPAVNPSNRFIIITDEGRVGKMRSTSRRIQRVNFIPSKFSARSYRREITSLIEDPLPKNSSESHFIQACDLVAYIVYLHGVWSTGVTSPHGRLPPSLTKETVTAWLDQLTPSLNTSASTRNKYGIVAYPRK